MIGSLLFYLFTGTTLQSQVFNLIPGDFLPGKWTGGFDQDLKAVLIDAHARALTDLLVPKLLPEVADGVLEVARALTHPRPTAAWRQTGA